jgi:predicted transcriptional regulator
LIDEELSFIEKSLKQRRKEMEDVREVIKRGRRTIDSEIENLIFSMIVNQNSNTTEESINAIIGKTKSVVNESEQAIRKVVSKMSITLGS